jgi:hypothetical protein
VARGIRRRGWYEKCGNDNEITLAYNPASQIVSRIATNLAYAWTGHGNGSTASSFDGLNRLVGYSHDARGNRTSDGTRTYTYDSESRLSLPGYGYDRLAG